MRSIAACSLIAGVLGASLALGCASRPEPEARTATADAVPQDRPVVVIVHAEWCAACRRVAPVIAWLREDYADRVTFVELDVTDEDAERRSAAMAAPLGLGAFFAQNRGKPGITILGRGRKAVHYFAVEGRPGPYRSALAEAFATFGVPETSPAR